MSLKRVNLYHLYTSSRLGITDFRKYEKVLSKRQNISNLGEREKDSLFYLVELFIENNCEVKYLDNFYYSYTIPHIGKEFDLLKIDNDKILNIELKSENVGLDRIKKQLVTNYKYLKYLSKESHLFTFVSDEKKFYKLDTEKKLVLTTKEEVLSVLKTFNSNDYPDINGLFETADFLVSPNVNPQKFINGHYFLTTQQELIKNTLLSTINTNNVFKITGEAGTGKTLLLFDIARELALKKSTLIINCNKPNPHHETIMREILNLSIISQDELLQKSNYLDSFSYVLLDEAQRMKPRIWEMLLQRVKDSKNVIFTLDPKQVLSKEEIKANYNLLINKLQPCTFSLSNRIRINNSIKDFTYRLFDLSLVKYKLDLEDVTLHYALDSKELKTYFNLYASNYTYIKIPNTNYDCGNITNVTIDDVVGKDYENVLIVMDDKFYYQGEKLQGHESVKNDYLYLKVLYQGLTRTREKLTLIVYKNKKLFKEILKNIK